VAFTAQVKSADGQVASVAQQVRPADCDRFSAKPSPTPVPVAPENTATPTATPAASPTAPAQPGDAAILFSRVNALRAEHGLDPYPLNDQLTAAALRHSQDMANTGNIDHTGSDGSTARQRIVESGYGEGPTGELIFGGETSVDEAWSFWTNSQLTLDNLLSTRYREIGVGVVQQAKLVYFTLTFGAR
jgi:uncharacterized protein YkwD